jgi:site-specific DNA recombinase
MLVSWKLDRVSRSALDTLQLFQWLEQRGKRLVCVDDGIDTGTSMGKLFGKLAAIFAEMERETIIARVLDSRRELRAQGRWDAPVWLRGRSEPRRRRLEARRG